MKPSVLDTCVFYKLSNGSLHEIQATQVDDTLGRGDDEFAALEEEKYKKLECKPRTNSLSFQFNGFWLTSTSLEDEFCTRRTTAPPSEKLTQALCLKVGYFRKNTDLVVEKLLMRQLTHDLTLPSKKLNFLKSQRRLST